MDMQSSDVYTIDVTNCKVMHYLSNQEESDNDYSVCSINYILCRFYPYEDSGRCFETHILVVGDNGTLKAIYTFAEEH